jgi:TonB family protein
MDLLRLELEPGDGPPPLDPSLTAPLDSDERFFTTLPEREPLRPGVLAVTLAVHLAFLSLLAWREWKTLAAAARNMQTALQADRRYPVALAPRLPAGMKSLGAGALPLLKQPPPRLDDGRRPYTHVNQEEQAPRDPHEKNLWSDRNRAGASPELAARPDPRNPDPVSNGRDVRRNALSAAGPDVPGEPGSHDKLAGAPGAKKSAGQNGENGVQMAEMSGRPAFNPSTHSYYGVPLAPGHSRLAPSGRADSDSPAAAGANGRTGVGRNDRGGDKSERRPGAPGESAEGTDNGANGEGGIASIRRQLSDLARAGMSDKLRNPNGKNFETGPMSFDTQGYELGEYERKVHAAVEREWDPSTVTRELGIHGCTLASFTIERDGRVSDVTLLNTSDVSAYDQAALAALKNARLPPLPAKYPLKQMTSSIGFFVNEAPGDNCGKALKG